MANSHARCVLEVAHFAMDWKAPKMTMGDALRTARMWDAAGATDHAFFRTPH